MTILRVADMLWFGEDGGLAAAVGAVRAMPGTADLACARLAIAPAALFGELAARSRGMLPIVVVDGGGRSRARMLDAGAADAVPASIEADELAARLRAVRRRSAERLVTIGDLAVDLIERRATRGGRPLALHPRELAVLACLARHRDRPVSRARLYEEVWLRRFDPGTNVVAVTISRLRARLGVPPLLHTVADGYRLGEGSERTATLDGAGRLTEG